MPGPVSDSYDPEFGTAENARAVILAVQSVIRKIESQALKGKPVKNILEVVTGDAGPLYAGPISEREWRVIRFAMNRALETI